MNLTEHALEQTNEARREAKRLEAQRPERTGDNPDHAKMILALTDWIGRHRLAVDAVGLWRDRDTWQLATMTSDVIAREFAMEYRRDNKVNLSYICETLESLAFQWEQKRKGEVIKVIIETPRHPNADGMLILWLRAVIGSEPEPFQIAALRQWMWMVKRSMTGDPVEHHLMIVLFGIQGTGKTVAITKLLSILCELAMVPCDSSLLTDQRWRPALGKYLAAFWDELDGLERSDRAALKQVITAASLPYRPMRTNRTETIPVYSRFIGASNTPVAALFRDPTGARRFVQIKTADKLDWDVINAIDYAALWSGVRAEEPAPIIEHLDALKKEQERQRWRDTVGEWLMDEDWGVFTDAKGTMVGRCDPVAGVICQQAYARYLDWCLRHQETHPFGQAQFGIRLAEEGFSKHRGRDEETGNRMWIYRRRGAE